MFPASYIHHKCCLVNSSCKGRIRMPGYTSVNTPSQWLTISWAKRANIHSQPCAKILKLCFRNFPKVRTADEGHARTQRCLRGKGLGAAHPRARKALSLPARLRPRLRSGTCLRPRTAVGALPCRASLPPFLGLCLPPRAVPGLFTGSTGVLGNHT